MNIAISFSGEGLGHATRMGALAKQLGKKHKLTFWCSSKVREFIRNMQPKVEINEITHIGLVKKNHRVQYSKTALGGLNYLVRSRKITTALAEQLKKKKIDAVISDYEPALASAAKKAGIPVLAFNHQGIIQRVGGWQKQAIAARIANKFMMPYFNELIISSFYEGDVGPIIRPKIKRATPKKGDFILVYVKSSLSSYITSNLEKFGGYTFKYFPDKKSDFVKALASCKAVIAPAGHQLISECLLLGKPLLVIPEKQQFEQLLNAQMLVRSGRGMMCFLHEFDQKLEKFLKKIDDFPFHTNKHNTRFCFRDDTCAAVQKVNQFLQKHVTRNAT